MGAARLQYGTALHQCSTGQLQRWTACKTVASTLLSHTCLDTEICTCKQWSALNYNIIIITLTANIFSIVDHLWIKSWCQYERTCKHTWCIPVPALVVPATRRLSLGDRAFLFAAARAWNTAVNSHCCVNPVFILSSHENSSIHRIFPTILVTLSTFWANVTCLC